MSRTKVSPHPASLRSAPLSLGRGEAFFFASFFALLLSVGCAKEKSHVQTFPNAPVILISIDTLRSDRLPAYGYTGVETPHIDRLRADSILFEHAWSHCPMTLPSHVSMLTGLLPNEHGVRNNVGYRYEPTPDGNLPQILERHGYGTAASVSSYVLRAGTGMGPMFGEYDDEMAIGSAGGTGPHQREGGRAVAFARKWIGENASTPFFFLLHLYEPHAPYEPPEPFRSRYPDAYNGEIAAADALLGEFFDFLRERNLYDDSIIILTSDHGEGLMDHGEDQHGILLYREAIQVPLIVKLPRNYHAGGNVKTPVQHIDLFPTVLSLLGLQSPARTEAYPLMRFVGDDESPPRTIYSETLYPRIHLGWSELRSLISDQKHYIEGPRPELYDMARDPGERQNLIATDRRAAATLRKALAQRPSAVEDVGEIDPEEARKLAALGYLGTPSRRDGQALPNPMDEVESIGRIREAFRLGDERDFDRAIPILQELLARNPSMADLSVRLGEALTATGRYREAIAVYRDAIRRSERFSSDLALSLAGALLLAESFDEARAHAELAIVSNPIRANEVLARVALERGNLQEAKRRANLAIDPKQPQPSIMLLRAEIHRSAGDYAAALEELGLAERRAKELGVERLQRLEHLKGDVFARMGREAEAEAAYRRAIAEFPYDLQSYTNLAIIYFIQGKPERVRATLDAMVEENPNERARQLKAETLASFEE